jgi:MFS family permease
VGNDGVRPASGWLLRISAYWFATSFKWFLALLLLPNTVNKIIPEGAQNSVWGMILAIGAAEAMIGPALMGWLSDRTSTKWGRRRPWIAAGALLTVAACAILGTAASVPSLIVGYLLLQIADDVATGPYSAVIPEHIPGEHRGRASGMLGALNFSAQILAAICIIAGLVLGIGNMPLFGIIAALHLICLAIVWFAIPEEPFPPKIAQAKGIEIWIAPFRNANFRWIWITRFLSALGFYILTSFGQNYLKDVVKQYSPLPHLTDDPADAAKFAAVAVIVLISLTGVAGAVIGGRLADRVGRKKVIQAAGVIMFAAILPFALIDKFTAILGLALIFGVGYGAFTSADWALVADVLPDDSGFAKDMGIWQSSVVVPQLLNGILGATIDGVNRQSQNAGYTVVFMVSALAFLLGSALIAKVQIERRLQG